MVEDDVLIEATHQPVVIVVVAVAERMWTNVGAVAVVEEDVVVAVSAPDPGLGFCHYCCCDPHSDQKFLLPEAMLHHHHRRQCHSFHATDDCDKVE